MARQRPRPKSEASEPPMPGPSKNFSFVAACLPMSLVATPDAKLPASESLTPRQSLAQAGAEPGNCPSTNEADKRSAVAVVSIDDKERMASWQVGQIDFKPIWKR